MFHVLERAGPRGERFYVVFNSESAEEFGTYRLWENARAEADRLEEIYAQR